jgi:hypothetical protein
MFEALLTSVIGIWNLERVCPTRMAEHEANLSCASGAEFFGHAGHIAQVVSIHGENVIKAL